MKKLFALFFACMMFAGPALAQQLQRGASNRVDSSNYISSKAVSSYELECVAAELGYSLMGLDSVAPMACTKLCVNPGAVSHCTSACECKANCQFCCDNFDNPDRSTCLSACNAKTWTC